MTATMSKTKKMIPTQITTREPIRIKKKGQGHNQAQASILKSLELRIP